MIYLSRHKNVAHGAFRRGNVGGCLRRNVSVRLAEALALGDVSPSWRMGDPGCISGSGAPIEEHLGVLCFYEIFQHFNVICAGYQSFTNGGRRAFPSLS